MNIVILSDGATILGGAEKVAFLSAVELAKRGHDVTLFAAVGPVDPMLEGVENLKVVCLDHGLTKDSSDSAERRARFRRRVWNEEAAKNLSGMLEGLPKGNAVVHAHCYLAMLSPSTMDAAIRSGIPVVATLHDYGVACPLRNFYHARENAICKRKPMGLSCVSTDCTGAGYPSKLRALVVQRSHVRRGRIPERLRHAIYVSDFSRRILETYLPHAEGVVVRNPIDAQKADRVDVRSNDSVAYIGRLIPEKDPVTLARAARMAGVQAVFVGSGPEESAVREANPDAEITGWSPPEEVYARLRRARSFAIPSIWYECAPLAPLEAMALGVPVVTSAENASVDYVRHGENGLVFPSRDVEALAECLNRLKVDDVADAMGRAAYDGFWAAPWTPSSHVDALEDVYRAMLR